MIKTIVDKYIDFDELIKCEHIYNNKLIIRIQKDSHISICDEKTPNDYVKKTKKLVNKFVEFNDMKKLCSLDADIHDVNIKFILYSINNYYSFSAVITGEYKHFSIFGLIDDNKNKFIFLGEEGCHPYFITDSISYGNSYGSGPEITNEVNDKPDYFEIIGVTEQYFSDFSENKYH